MNVPKETSAVGVSPAAAFRFGFRNDSAQSLKLCRPIRYHETEVQN